MDAVNNYSTDTLTYKLAWKLCKGYFQATRRYAIYSPRAQPDVYESRVQEVPKNNEAYFSYGWGSRTVA